MAYTDIRHINADELLCQLLYLAVERTVRLTTVSQAVLMIMEAAMPAGHLHRVKTSLEDHLTGTHINTQMYQQ